MRGRLLVVLGTAVCGAAAVAHAASAPVPGHVGVSGSLAFLRFTENAGRSQLWVQRRGAARPTLVRLRLDAVDGPAWAPDGTRLVVVGGRTHAGLPRVTEADDLYLVGADGRGLRRLTHDAAHESGAVWDPRGRRIAYVRGAAAAPYRSSIVVAPLRGGPARTLTFGNVDLEPSWSADGRSIAFLRNDPRTHTTGIWVVHADGTGLHRILRRLTNVTDPVWSPRGGRLVVTDGRRLLVVRPDGRQLRVVARLTADADGARLDPEPAWSADGTQIVYVQARAGATARADLWSVNARGGRPVRLTRSPGLDLSPALAR